MTTTTDTFQARVEAAWGSTERSSPFNLHRMGSDQWSMLSSMCEHGGWSDGAGWTWSNRSSTIKLADSLVKRGLLVREDRVDSYNRPRREIQQERDQANRDRWAEQERQQNIRNLDRRANDFAVAKLMQAHNVEYHAWVNQYKADHPVES
jgi:hypothetical protein